MTSGMTIFMFALSKPIKKHDANTTASTLWEEQQAQKADEDQGEREDVGS